MLVEIKIYKGWNIFNINQASELCLILKLQLHEVINCK